jgi:hypothetical protein
MVYSNNSRTWRVILVEIFAGMDDEDGRVCPTGGHQTVCFNGVVSRNVDLHSEETQPGTHCVSPQSRRRLARWAKLAMAIQATACLIVMGLVIARAVNIVK